MTHVWALVKRVRYLRHSLSERLAQGGHIAPDVVREGDALVWALTRLLVNDEAEHATDRSDIVAATGEWDALTRRLAQRKREALLRELVPGSPAAVARISNLLEATEAEGRNEPTFTSAKGQ